MLSSITSIFSLIWRSPRDRREARFALLGDLVTFSSECESWLIELHALRQKDAGVDIGDEVREYLPQISKQDAIAQKIQWRFRKEFPKPEILSGISELMRRISITRQMLLFGTPRFRQYAFADGLKWIECQTAKIMRLSAKTVGIEIDDPDAPFFSGFFPLGMNCEPKYQNNGEPWISGKQKAIQEELEELGVSKEKAEWHSKQL